MAEITDSKEVKKYGDVLTSPIRFEIVKFLAKRKYPNIAEIERHLSEKNIKTSKNGAVTYPTIQKHLDYLHRKGIVYFSNATGAYRARLLKNIKVYVEDSDDIGKWHDIMKKGEVDLEQQRGMEEFEEVRRIEESQMGEEKSIQRFMEVGMSRQEAEEFSENIHLLYDREDITLTEGQELFTKGTIEDYTAIMKGKNPVKKKS